MGYHPRIRVNSNTRCMKVTQYSFEPHESLGKVMRVIGWIDGYPVGLRLPLDMFRDLALHMRDRWRKENPGKRKRFHPHEFNYEDGLRVGRYLLDKWVLVEGEEIKEVFDGI